MNPVLELYTSEGCSSCPPADRWISQLKDVHSAHPGAVVQAFHVSYWDYIGWVDRFAVPTHTIRQKRLNVANGLRGVYTPQMLKDGRDWRGWWASPGGSSLVSVGSAQWTIAMQREHDGTFSAKVLPASSANATEVYEAYWTLTEHAHHSRVSAGENKGKQLAHDYVVRQYQPVGSYSGAQTLRFTPFAAIPAHPQRVNLVMHEPKSGKTLQALSLACPPA